MKFNTSALFAALFGLAATEVAAPVVRASAGRSRSNKRLPRSRIPGNVQPAGSKLAKAAMKGRVGIW